MTERTKQYVIILIVSAAVLVVLTGFGFFLYELYIGRAQIDSNLAASLNGFLIAMLTIAGIVINGIVSRRHYEQLNRSTQNVVKAESNDLKDKVMNGFALRVGERAGDVAAQKVADAVLPVALANRDALDQLRTTGASEQQAATDRNTTALDANTAKIDEANKRP